MATSPYIIQAFHDAVLAVCPNLDGVAMDNADDRSTWVIHFLPGATAQEIAAAKTVQESFDPKSVSAPLPSITKRQMLNWLLANKGKTETDILAAIATIPDATVKAEAEIDWKYPDGDFKRTNPFMDQLGPLFNMTPEEIDRAFVEAADPKAKWNQ